ncbi:MAG: PCRF domain-containing protein, partial [Anaerolineales bacterium]|nr:PCRF domain-containing protein [Anaerolineales bacterium]
MLDQIAKVVSRFEEIELTMTNPAVIADYNRLTDLAQERAEMEPLVLAYREHAAVRQDIGDARDLLEIEEDEAMQAFLQEELTQLARRQEELEVRMRSLLVPKDPRDKRNVFIEIRAGAGGDEAGIFAADLLRMYARYAEGRNWKPEIIDENSTGVGGYKEVILSVKGEGAYSRLKFESGVHRVQRVPVTESQGRI